MRIQPLGLALGLATAFILTALIGVWAAYDRQVAWPRFWLIAAGVAMAVSIAWAGRRWGEPAWGGIGLGCGLLAGAVGLYFLLANDWQTGATTKFDFVQRLGLWVQTHRPAVSLPEDLNGNVAGGALALLLPLGTAGTVWAWRRCKALALAGGGALTLALAALFLTASRGAWAGLAGGILVAWAIRWRKAHGWLLAALVVVPVGLFVAAVALPGFDRWLGNFGGGGSAVGRAQLWRDGLALLGDYPFTGGGLGMTTMVYSTYGLLLHVGFTTHFHNLFLQIAFEQGLPGLAAFIAMLVIGVWQAMQGVSSADGPGRIYPLAAVAALTALVIHGTADAGLYASRLAPVLFLPLGFALGIGPVEARPSRTTEIAGLVAASVALSLLLLPASRAVFRSNLGAVAQTRAELVIYTWPKIPIQDALRRSPTVDLAPAIAYYGAALADAPWLASANRRLGQIELSRGDYAAAREHLLAAYHSAPDQQANRFLLGESYAIAGQVEEAAALWRTVGARAWWDEDWIGWQAFRLRQWWYESIGEPEKSRRIGVVIEQLSQDARAR